MPTDHSNDVSLEDYIAICAKVQALLSDSDAVYIITVGDFNCSLGYFSSF